MENDKMIYDQPWCKIFYRSDVKAVVLEWHSFASSEQFREACNDALKVLVEKKAKLMLADNRLAKVVLAEDQQWMNEEWFPRAYSLGYRGSAVLLGKDLFREVAVKSIVHDMEEGKFKVQFFDKEDKALDWLSNFDKNA